jgi:hypothetical protein
MLIIWASSFLGILVIAFSTTFGILINTHKDYGAAAGTKDINPSNIWSVSVMNEYTAVTQTFPNGKAYMGWEEQPFINQRSQILNRLDKGGRTNLWSELVMGRMFKNTDPTIDSNFVMSYNTFNTTYKTNAIMIEFRVPQYHIEITRVTALKDTVKLRDGNGERPVWRIYIPLDHTGDYMQAQTWYLYTKNPSTERYDFTLNYKVTTFGNYSKLWNYVKEIKPSL